jgi:hypothetical protein
VHQSRTLSCNQEATFIQTCFYPWPISDSLGLLLRSSKVQSEGYCFCPIPHTGFLHSCLFWLGSPTKGADHPKFPRVLSTRSFTEFSVLTTDSLLNLQAFVISRVHVALLLPRSKARHKAGYAEWRNRHEASKLFKLLRLTRILADRMLRVCRPWLERGAEKNEK